MGKKFKAVVSGGITDKDAAEKALHDAALTVKRLGEAGSHGVKLVKKGGAYQVELWERDET